MWRWKEKKSEYYSAARALQAEDKKYQAKLTAFQKERKAKYAKKKAGEKCDPDAEKSGCVIEHRCGKPVAKDEAESSKVKDIGYKCIPALECKKEATVSATEIEWECSASYLTFTIASLFTIATFVWNLHISWSSFSFFHPDFLDEYTFYI